MSQQNSAAAASVAATSNNVASNEANPYQQCDWEDPLQKAVSEIAEGTMARQMCEAYLARRPEGGLEERMAKLQEIRQRFEQE